MLCVLNISTLIRKYREQKPVATCMYVIIQNTIMNYQIYVSCFGMV